MTTKLTNQPLRLNYFRPILLGLFLTVLSPLTMAWDRDSVTHFALLPSDAGNPEALTVDAYGHVYASSFGGIIYHFTPNGKLSRSIAVSPSSGLITDLAFHPDTDILLVIDFGGGKILEVNPATGIATVFSDIPGEDATPNEMTFDKAGNVYVSDSVQGIIWRIPPSGGTAEVWINHSLLTAQGYPGFGANGIAFNQSYSVLYVANTGEDTIVQIPVDENGNAQTPSVLTNGINGPDGIQIDQDDNIWIAANQSNQIVVIDKTGKGIGVFGDFEGITSRGVVKGLLVPSDIVFFGKYIYVTNFAWDFSTFGLTQHYTSQWTRLVKRHSLVRFKMNLKKSHDED